MTHLYKICESCGSDPFKTVDYDKKSKELEEISNRFKSVCAYHGKDRAEWEIRDISQTESMKWLQRKVKKQAAAIQTLEAKIKRLGEQPYEPIP